MKPKTAEPKLFRVCGARAMKYDASLALQQRFHQVIPGGSHTYAKGDDQFPEFMPTYIVRGSGSHVWDADGNEYIEYGKRSARRYPRSRFRASGEGGPTSRCSWVAISSAPP